MENINRNWPERLKENQKNLGRLFKQTRINPEGNHFVSKENTYEWLVLRQNIAPTGDTYYMAESSRIIQGSLYLTNVMMDDKDKIIRTSEHWIFSGAEPKWTAYKDHYWRETYLDSKNRLAVAHIGESRYKNPAVMEAVMHTTHILETAVDLRLLDESVLEIPN